MGDLNELDCRIYVEADLTADELAALLAGSLPGAATVGSVTRIIRVPSGEIEVRNNKEWDTFRAREFPDGFLYFRYTLEVYPFPATRHEDRVSLVANILNLLWSRGLPAVAACDMEQELPNGGGYNNSAIPWPSKGTALSQKT